VKSPPPPPPAATQPTASGSGAVPPTQGFPYPYPFAYGYMSPPTIVNGQMVLTSPPPQVGSSASAHSRKPILLVANVFSKLMIDAVDTGAPEVEQAVAPPPQPESHSKRSPRHCCKCGSQDCKGKGGRNFCTNPCQDCGKMDCKGRNSRRPDKKCSEGWT
jgi:hypothetical protein